MTRRRDDDFRPGLRGAKCPRAPDQRFTARVLAQLGSGAVVRRNGLVSRLPRGPAHFRRGAVAALLAVGKLGPRARRVIVKFRLVKLKLDSRAVATHLRYLARDGVTRDGMAAQPYDAQADTADLKAFEAKGRADRHQFRFIVSPEDAVELEDLRGFTRALMRRMEADLETRLEWVAVDHWDTDNPHTHVVLRGVDETGRDLIIDRGYLAHGMRLRASALATEWLGLRTELEIRQTWQHEVEQDRWTGLDRELHAHARDGLVESQRLPADESAVHPRTLLIGRLRRLEQMGLAQQIAPGDWQLRHDAEAVLRASGERGDILRTLQRALGRERRELAISDAQSASLPIIGRIAGKGLADELTDRPYVVIDGIDGRAHYVRLPEATDLSELPLGGIAEVGRAPDRVADRNIAALAKDGFYQPLGHLAQLSADPAQAATAEAVIEGHVRRLEALRRAGIVERFTDGTWGVPPDLVDRGRAHDRAHSGGIRVLLHSHLSVEQQISATGATWLDRQLLSAAALPATTYGFGASIQDALRARADFLAEHGFAERRDSKVILRRDALNVLQQRELEHASQSIARETGLMPRAVMDGTPISGIYRRSIVLASGRFAMLDDGLGFSLVPWRPIVEQHLGRPVSAVIRGEHVSWQIARSRAIGLG